jgi:L-lactate dehydrogenase complex protein LldG
MSESSNNLINEFMISAVETGSTVECISKTADALNNRLDMIVGNRIVLLGEPDYLEPDLFSVYKRKTNVIKNPAKVFLSTVPVGITDAFCAIASSGSVCISINKGMSSFISMLVYEHIVIVDSRTIIPKPRDIFLIEYKNGIQSYRSFSIVTGPSATSDMGPLVRGAHGPGKLHIIILN